MFVRSSSFVARSSSIVGRRSSLDFRRSVFGVRRSSLIARCTTLDTQRLTPSFGSLFVIRSTSPTATATINKIVVKVTSR